MNKTTLTRHLKPVLAGTLLVSIAAIGCFAPIDPGANGALTKAALYALGSLCAGYLAAKATQA